MNVAGFVHIAKLPNYEKNEGEIKERINKVGLGAKCNVVCYNETDPVLFEFPTLRQLYEYAKVENGYVFYAHIKGSWHPNVSWREYLEYWTLDRHEDMIRELEKGADTCGVDWEEKPWPHYSGNFWWARCEFVRKLQEPAMTRNRFDAERWIGTEQGVRAELYHAGINFYKDGYPEEKYKEVR